MEYFFFATLKRSPVLLVAFIGMVIAVITWKRHPRISFQTLLALGLAWVQWVVFTVAFYFVGFVANLLGGDARWFQTGLYFVQDIIFAIMLVLLVSAALTQRNQPAAATN